MARKFDFTRTIESTKFTALVFNKTTAEPENLTFTVPGKYTIDDPKLEKLAQKIIVAPELKFIEIVDAESEIKMYGWSLNDIMPSAVVLNPETRQPYAD